MRTVLVLVASIFIALSSSASIARPFQINECNVTMPCDFSGSQMPSRANSYRHAMASIDADRGKVVGDRPAGCPRSFCGCGASLRVFGRILPGLNLAANWLRFPRTAPAPGMVAARRGHVFVLERHIEGDTWMAYDANSGRHATRIHARSLRGYTIVNAHAA
jgi:hypothetical protein